MTRSIRATLSRRSAALNVSSKLDVDQVLEQAPRLADDMLERLVALRSNELVRVASIRQDRDFGIEARSVTRLLGSASRLASCRVAVEEQSGSRGVPAQEARLIGRERRTERGDDVLHAACMQADHVEISLDDNGVLLPADRVAPLPKAEEGRALRRRSGSRAN